MVTAFGREEVREEAERLQLDGFLVKPVTRSMIVDTLVTVFADARAKRSQARRRTASATRLRGARILLAEDNEINQQIAVELLEGVGAKVTVANNGREAVDMLFERPAAAAVRRGADGPADARDGRLPGDREDPLGRAFRDPADHRHDGACHDGGAPALPRRRHERPHLPSPSIRAICSRPSRDSMNRRKSIARSCEGQPTHPLEIRAAGPDGDAVD